MYTYNFGSFAINFADGCFGAVDAISKAYVRAVAVLTSEKAIAGYRLAFYVTRNTIEIFWLVALALAATIRQIANRQQATTPQERWEAAIVPHPSPDLSEVFEIEPEVAEVEEMTVGDIIANTVVEDEPIAEEEEVMTELPAIGFVEHTTAHIADYAAVGIVALRKECLSKGHKGAARWNKAKCLRVLGV